MTVKKLMFILMVVATMLFVLVGCEPAEESEYTLTIDVENEAGGAVVRPELEKVYTGGELVTIEVEVEDGYFLVWEGSDGEDVAGPDEDGDYKITMNNDKEITAKFVEGVRYDIAEVSDWSSGGNITRDPDIDTYTEDGMNGIVARDMQSDGEDGGGAWIRYTIPEAPMDLSEYDKIIVEFKHNLGWDSYFQFSPLTTEENWGTYEVDGSIGADEEWVTLELVVADSEDMDWTDIESFVIQAYSEDDALDLYVSSITAIIE